MRITYYKQNEDSESEIMSVTNAKKLIKSQGGYARTEIYERDGTLCDTKEIKLKGDNTKFKMNRHL